MPFAWCKFCSGFAELESIPKAELMLSSKCTPLAGLGPKGAKGGGGWRRGGGVCKRGLHEHAMSAKGENHIGGA